MKHLKLILKSLFSNSACVEASRTREIKYNIIAIVFALLGIFLAVLPTTITSFKKSGSDWMNTSYVYNLDTGFYNFCDTAKTKNITLTIKEDEKKSKYLEIKNWENVPAYENRTIKKKIDGEEKTFQVERFDGLHPYVFKHKIGEEENMRILEVYDFTSFDNKQFQEYYTNILSNINPTIDSTKDKKERWLEWTINDKGEAEETSRSSAVVFFGKNTVVACNAKASTSMVGDYQHSTADRELINEYYVQNNPSETFTKWKPFFNEAYINNRWISSWRSTGIMAGVDAGVLLFMGLMVFILTRGKNNPFRIYSFWDSQKIAYYASFTPSILALGFGFLLTNMAMMFYVLALGIRVMWLSMRTLRYNAPAK